MRSVHLILEGFSRPVSGADIRNHALAEALRAQGPLLVLPASTLPGAPDPRGALPRTVLPLGAEAIASAVQQVTRFAPDLIVLGGVGLLRLAGPLRSTLPHVRRIVDFHNVESLLLQEMDRAADPRAEAQHAAEWRAAEAADRAVADWGEALWFCARADIARARRLGITAPAHVVPNAPPGWARPLPLPPPGPPRLLFMAHLGYPPNILAARMLMRAILPGLRAALPGASVLIAGRDPDAALRAEAAATPGLRLLADPPDPEPLYAHSDLAVMPILEGGGTRIKLLEAFCVGRPVVATAKAVEGHGLQPGRHYLRAETPEEFITQILRLQAEPGLGAALIAAGHDWIGAHGTPAAIAAAVAAAVAAGLT